MEGRQVEDKCPPSDVNLAEKLECAAPSEI
jgi:hypothetical protein